MSWELLSASKKSKGVTLDPRTKLIVLITICFLVLGGEGGGLALVTKPMLTAIPILLLFCFGKKKAALVCVIIYTTCYFGEQFVVPVTTGAVNFILLFLCGFISRVLPGLAMGYYTVRTTTVSELVAAMQRIHLTEKLLIPLSVMFRFFPTVGEEYHAIGDAMRMRGIRFGGKKTVKMLEYRFVPMMICSIKIGEELSAAALTRGLGAPVRRTNICKIGFKALDIVLIAFCVVLFILTILRKIGLLGVLA